MQPFLVNVEESAEEAYEFLDAVGLELTCLLDEDGDLYNGYALNELGFGEAPFPIRIVIDRDGIITFADRESTPDPLREAIEAAL